MKYFNIGQQSMFACKDFFQEYFLLVELVKTQYDRVLKTIFLLFQKYVCM